MESISTNISAADADCAPPDADAILQRVFADHEADRIPVPSMPETALRVRKLANAPDVEISELAAALELEPAIAGRLVAAANSALDGGRVKVATVRDAVVRLGLRYTCSLATSLAIKGLFRTSNPELDRLAHELWRRNVRVGAITRVLAEQAGERSIPVDVEKAFLVGLLHDLGPLALLSYIEAIDAHASARSVQTCAAGIGRMVSVLVLDRWGLDTDFQQAAEAAGDWQWSGAEESRYVDLTNLARHQAAVAEGRVDGLPGVADLLAYDRLQPGAVDAETGMLERLLGNLRIDAIEQQLH